MNKKMLFLQTIIICGLWGVILFIGFSTQDREYIHFTSDLKKASLLYMKDNNITPKLSESIVIFVDDLINQKYIKDSEEVKKYCVDSVVYSNEILKDKFVVNNNCEKNEE